ncbi:MAG TPA: hypothetical protein VEK80_08975 [Kribbellaceae bacterium]|nr:hypothetical protein [Kribbellaceae bacterium]
MFSVCLDRHDPASAAVVTHAFARFRLLLKRVLAAGQPADAPVDVTRLELHELEPALPTRSLAA